MLPVHPLVREARSGAPAEIDLSTVFAVGELSALLMNFPTPFPKKKKAHLRLTYLDRLMGYRPLLGRGAGIRLRTDSQPLRDFIPYAARVGGVRGHLAKR